MTSTVPDLMSEQPRPDPAARDGATPSPAVELVLPVYNESAILERSVRRLHGYLTDSFPVSFRITIADNASTDATWDVARGLAQELPAVAAVHLDQKGRGRALREVWSRSNATVVAYMDIDLSTDLAALLPLVAPLLSGHSDVAIGSRLNKASRVVRGTKREVISRSYNLLLRTTLRTRFSDAQCGFKAIRTDAARQLLPLVENTGWFFDTELLVLAERSGLRIHEVPVDWVDDPDSRVDIRATVLEDLHGVLRMMRALATGRLPIAALRRQLARDPVPAFVPGVPIGMTRQAVRFAAVGVGSTVAYLVLFVALRGALGAQGANVLALLATAVANTAANRRLTFGVRGARHVARSQLEGLAVFGVGLALTSGALAALGTWDSDASRPLEVGVLVGANLMATIVRFLLFRAWVFHPRRQSGTQSRTSGATSAVVTPGLPPSREAV